MITLSENAVEEVKRLLRLEKKEDWGLRVGVVGGGCSGLSYTLAFEEEPKKADTVEDINGIKVYVDPKSYLFLNGIELDYSTDLLNGGFKFINPNATRTCSCGSSFSA
jgi:iron-sulfur cluster assembly protein